MKKVLKTALTAAIILILAMCTVYASEETAAENELLVELGIISDEDRYRDGITTRAEFVVYAVRLANQGVGASASQPQFTDVAKSYWAYDELSTAYAMGLIREKTAGRFDPDSPIESTDAARILLCAVGYTDYVKNMSDTNMLRLADSVKLFDGASKSVGMPLAREDVFAMLFNALTVDMPYLQSVSTDGTPQYYLKKGVNILSERFDIYFTEGVVTADDNAAITGEPAGEGAVIIDGVEYDGAGTKPERFLGYNVGCYWRDYDTSRELVTIYEKKNTVCEIDFDDAEYTGAAFVEVTDSKRTSRRINAKSTILINGSVVGDNSQINDSLANYAGSVKMIDNDRDGVYDVIIIERYINILVDSYDNIEEILTGQNGEVFKLKGYDDVVVKDSFLDETDISVIAVDTVLSVFVPLTKESRIVLVAGAPTFGGELVSMDSSDEKNETLLCDDDIAYSISKFCLFDAAELMIGENYTFYPDWSGDIVYLENRVENLKIGYLRRAINSETGDGVQLKIFESNGSNQTFDLREKVTLRDAEGKSQSLTDEEVYAILAPGGTTERQAIMYKLNNDDKVSRLWLATTDQSLMFHILEDDLPSKSTNYRFEYRNNIFMGKYICTSDTKVLVVPENGNDDADYRIGSTGMFSNGSYVHFNNARQTIHMIGIEPDTFLTDVMVYEIDYTQPKGVYETSAPVVYYKKVQTVNDDGDKILRIYVVGSDGAEKSYDVEDCDDVLYDMNGRKVSFGDIIRIEADEKGRVLPGNIQSMYDRVNDTHIQYIGSSTVRYLTSVRVIPAEVIRREKNYIRFNTFAGSAPGGTNYKESIEIASISAAKVYVYDSAKNELTESTSARIVAGDKFLLYESYGVPKMIVYYK